MVSTGATATAAATTTASESPATTGAPTTGGSTAEAPGSSSSTTSASTTGVEGTSGGEDTSGGESTWDGKEPPCCVIPEGWPETDIFGEDIEGITKYMWAWFGLELGECGTLWIVEAYQYEDQIEGLGGGDFLRITIDEADWPNGFAGTGPAWIQAEIGANYYQLDWNVTVWTNATGREASSCETDEKPIQTDATVSVAIEYELNELEIFGTVNARYCPTLSLQANCP